MEFVIKQNALKDELGFVQGIVEKKSTIPVLSNILIESVGENTLRIVGTDLDVTIRCEVAASILQAGSICVQARKLFDIVRLLPDADVSFRKEENDWVKVECGRSNFRLAGVSREHFPEIPTFANPLPFSLPSKIFQYFIQHTSFAITNEQSRFTLSGAKFMVDESGVKMVTTDGHRLAFIARNDLRENSVNGTMDALIPKKALNELTKISRESDGSVMFGEDPNHIYFDVGGRLLITRKLSGTFPNYEMVIPKNNDKIATFDADAMRDAIRRVSLMADDRTRAVRFHIKPNEIHISSSSAEEGEANEIVETDYSGEEVQIGFNSQYVQDFLNILDTNNEEKPDETPTKLRVAFEFKDSNGQAMMKPAVDNGYEYKYVVMPMRV